MLLFRPLIDGSPWILQAMANDGPPGRSASAPVRHIGPDTMSSSTSFALKK